MKTNEELQHDAHKALECLFIAVEESVAKDVNEKVRAYISVLEKRHHWLEKHLDAIKIDCNLAFDEPFVITFERGVVGYQKRDGFKGKTLHETIDAAIAGYRQTLPK